MKSVILVTSARRAAISSSLHQDKNIEFYTVKEAMLDIIEVINNDVLQEKTLQKLIINLVI